MYTPQQNGVAERKNRTLIEAARTMLADSGLPTMFWSEAVNTACRVLNRVLMVKRFNKTSYELLNNRKPNLKGIEPFGVPCTFLKYEPEIQSKFDSKVEEGFFLGYKPGTIVRCVYNNRTKEVVSGKNVKIVSYKSVVHTSNGNSFDYDKLHASFNMPSVPAGDNFNEDVVLLRHHLDCQMGLSVQTR